MFYALFYRVPDMSDTSEKRSPKAIRDMPEAVWQVAKAGAERDGATLADYLARAIAELERGEAERARQRAEGPRPVDAVAVPMGEGRGEAPPAGPSLADLAALMSATAALAAASGEALPPDLLHGAVRLLRGVLPRRRQGARPQVERVRGPDGRYLRALS